MLQTFYRFNKEAIVTLLQDFLEEDFYQEFPELRENASLIVTGSIATENYDRYSDVDLSIIFRNAAEVEKYLPRIKRYKKHIQEIKKPLQIHRPTTYNQIQAQLKTWEEDNLLRDYSQALIIHDPGDAFLQIQRAFAYYPQEIHREKVAWLFAEIIFQIKERLEITVTRRDPYFSQVVKMHIIRLFLNAHLLLEKKWPAFDKHAYQDVKRGSHYYALSIVDKLLAEQEGEAMLKLVNQMRQELERSLLEAHLIERKSEQYWLDLRPKYQVKFFD